MPNWAMETVKITGTRECIRAFSKRFICEGKQNQTEERYFARSFYEGGPEALSAEIDKHFENSDVNAKLTFPMYISFAWSAYSCLIDGYPQQFKDTCITLEEACIEDGVSVEIRTTESGMYFEEHISCDESGICVSTCEDLKTYKCPQCGETQGLASFEDPDEAECYECGCIGMQEDKNAEGDV